MRKFNYNRDTNVITGEVTRKRVEDDRCYVDIDFRATILRGTVTAPAAPLCCCQVGARSSRAPTAASGLESKGLADHGPARELARERRSSAD